MIFVNKSDQKLVQTHKSDTDDLHQSVDSSAVAGWDSPGHVRAFCQHVRNFAPCQYDHCRIIERDVSGKEDEHYVADQGQQKSVDRLFRLGGSLQDLGDEWCEENNDKAVDACNCSENHRTGIPMQTDQIHRKEIIIHLVKCCVPAGDQNEHQNKPVFFKDRQQAFPMAFDLINGVAITFFFFRCDILYKEIDQHRRSADGNSTEQKCKP